VDTRRGNFPCGPVTGPAYRGARPGDVNQATGKLVADRFAVSRIDRGAEFDSQVKLNRRLEGWIIGGSIVKHAMDGGLEIGVYAWKRPFKCGTKLCESWLAASFMATASSNTCWPGKHKVEAL